MSYCSKRVCGGEKKNVSVSLFSFALIYLLPVLIFFLVLLFSFFSSGCKRIKEQVETLRKISISFEKETQFNFSYKITLEQKDVQDLGLKVGKLNL
jgi:anionic cell wall polymer biosynthesis LytR-Cps2A-Psr (LCP) family protein